MGGEGRKEEKRVSWGTSHPGAATTAGPRPHVLCPGPGEACYPSEHTYVLQGGTCPVCAAHVSAGNLRFPPGHTSQSSDEPPEAVSFLFIQEVAHLAWTSDI